LNRHRFWAGSSAGIARRAVRSSSTMSAKKQLRLLTFPTLTVGKLGSAPTA
jgi:hypothetical protein